MATNRKIDDDENDILAQVIVPTLAVSKDIEFLQEKFGFKLLNIFPDDDPEVAVLYGHGLHLRLRREKEDVRSSRVVLHVSDHLGDLFDFRRLKIHQVVSLVIVLEIPKMDPKII